VKKDWLNGYIIRSHFVKSHFGLAWIEFIHRIG